MSDLVYKDILKDIEWFRYRHHIVDVLQDCFSMYATTISNQCDFKNFARREEEYLKLINKYSKEEQEWRDHGSADGGGGGMRDYLKAEEENLETPTLFDLMGGGTNDQARTTESL